MTDAERAFLQLAIPDTADFSQYESLFMLSAPDDHGGNYQVRRRWLLWSYDDSVR